MASLHVRYPALSSAPGPSCAAAPTQATEISVGHRAPRLRGISYHNRAQWPTTRALLPARPGVLLGGGRATPARRSAAPSCNFCDRGSHCWSRLLARCGHRVLRSGRCGAHHYVWAEILQGLLSLHLRRTWLAIRTAVISSCTQQRCLVFPGRSAVLFFALAPVNCQWWGCAPDPSVVRRGVAPAPPPEGLV